MFKNLAPSKICCFPFHPTERYETYTIPCKKTTGKQNVKIENMKIKLQKFCNKKIERNVLL